jgi:prepilin-type N-terminal cleavage/methylation domain-containing protein
VNARGISLIEVVVALSILSVVLMSLTGIMWQMGRQTRVAGVAAARTAAVESAAALAHAARWDSLTPLVGCAADTTAGLAYTRCYEVNNLSASLRQVRVIISPTASAVLAPDTLLVQRTRPRQRSPFNLPP